MFRIRVRFFPKRIWIQISFHQTDPNRIQVEKNTFSQRELQKFGQKFLFQGNLFFNQNSEYFLTRNFFKVEFFNLSRVARHWRWNSSSGAFSSRRRPFWTVPSCPTGGTRTSSTRPSPSHPTWRKELNRLLGWKHLLSILIPILSAASIDLERRAWLISG